MDVNEINQVAVIGAGIMGVGIAQNLAQAGLTVCLFDKDKSILESSMTQIKTNLELFQEYRLLTEEIAPILNRINPLPLALIKSGIQNCHYIVEAIPEILEAKKTLLTMLEEYTSDAVIASNTSSFTMDELSHGMRDPSRLIGVHYFNPAHIIPVVEIHWGEKTSKETIELVRQLMVKAGKKPILVRKVLPGFIVNRLTAALEREIDNLLDQGVVTPEDLDMAVKGSIGFRMSCLGPQETEDMIGLDTSMTVSRRVFKGLSNAVEPSSQLVAKVQAGDLGIKSGKGWYDYKGKSRNQVLDENNRKLLRQLAILNSQQKNENQ